VNVTEHWIEEHTPCCPLCYLATGESRPEMWRAEFDEFECQVHTSSWLPRPDADDSAVFTALFPSVKL
jgi:hypothetical protein